QPPPHPGYAEFPRLLLLIEDAVQERAGLERRFHEGGREIHRRADVGEDVDAADVAAVPKEGFEDRPVHGLASGMIARELHRLEREPRAWRDRRLLHH